MSPMISVIVPNYNHARFLPQRLESVLGQTREDLEVIILDDCSTDESREVIRSYAENDGRIRFCFNDTNSGSTFRQWGKGIAQAQGDCVWLAESDDWAEPDLLERLGGVLDSNPGVAIAFCDSTIHFEDVGEEMLASAYLRSRVPHADRWFARDALVDGAEFAREALFHFCAIVNASATLIRRSALASMGGVPADMRLAGDWMTYARLCERGKIAYIASPLNHNRAHANTVRMTVGRTFRYVDEVYRVRRCIQSRSAVAMDVRCQGHGEFFDEWSERIGVRTLGASLRAVARGTLCDPALPARFVQYCARRLAGGKPKQ